MTVSEAVIVIEGCYSAEKGGVIRECFYARDPSGFVPYPIALRTTGQASHPLMGRFWIALVRSVYAITFGMAGC